MSNPVLGKESCKEQLLKQNPALAGAGWCIHILYILWSIVHTWDNVLNYTLHTREMVTISLLGHVSIQGEHETSTRPKQMGTGSALTQQTNNSPLIVVWEVLRPPNYLSASFMFGIFIDFHRSSTSGLHLFHSRLKTNPRWSCACTW